MKRLRELSLILTVMGIILSSSILKDNQPISVSAISSVPSELGDFGGYACYDSKIIGPSVNLAFIAEKYSTTIHGDYVIPLSSSYRDATKYEVRIYYDNTIQYIMKGSFNEVYLYLSDSKYSLKNSLESKFRQLVNEGAIDPSSRLRPFSDGDYKGSYKGYVSKFDISFPPTDEMYVKPFELTIQNNDSDDPIINFINIYNTNTDCHEVTLHTNGQLFWSEQIFRDYTNEYLWSSDIPQTNPLTLTFEFQDWSLNGWQHLRGFVISIISSDQPQFSYTLSEHINLDSTEQFKIESPGVGFVEKDLSLGTVMPNSSTNVTVRVNIPKSSSATITDFYPSDFTLVNNEVTIEKYVGSTLSGTTTITVTPSTVGDNKEIQFTSTKTGGFLDTLDDRNWFLYKYTLQTPNIGGTTYTLPAATVDYTPFHTE